MQRRMFLMAALAATALVAGSLPSEAQRPGGRGGRGGFGGGGNLLSMPEVQKELKLDAAQIELLQGLNQGRRGGDRQSAQNLTPEERRARFAAARAEREKKIAEILNPTQVTRLKQLEIQRAGIRAIGREDVANSLKLSATQKSQVEAALQAERAASREAFQGFRGGQGQRPTPEQRQAAMAKLTELRTATDAKLNGVLTAQQKQQFQSMQGAPFTFPQRQRRQRRGGTTRA